MTDPSRAAIDSQKGERTKRRCLAAMGGVPGEDGLPGVGVGQERLARAGPDRRADGREVLLRDREPFGVDVADRQLGTRSRQFDGQRLPDTAPPPVTAGTGLGSFGARPKELRGNNTCI